jgi:hypothetical protein
MESSRWIVFYLFDFQDEKGRTSMVACERCAKIANTAVHQELAGRVSGVYLCENCRLLMGRDEGEKKFSLANSVAAEINLQKTIRNLLPKFTD